MGRRGRRSSSAFLGANGGSKSWSSGGRQRNFPTCGAGVRVGEPSKTRWGTRTRELVSSATGIGWHVLSSRDGERDLGPWGRECVGGWEQGVIDLGDSRPPKATACQTCASNVSGRRPGSLSPLQPCSPDRSNLGRYSGARKEKNRTETATNLCSPTSDGPLFLLCRVWLGAS